MKTDPCVVCGGRLELVRQREHIAMGNRGASVEVDGFRCDKCGEVFYSPAQMDAAQRAASDEIRRQEGLMTPSEIRRLREEKCDLSQADFERLLGVGPKTVVRWERGTVFQNRATDELMRVIDAVPEALAYLFRKHRLSKRASAISKSTVQNATVLSFSVRNPRRDPKLFRKTKAAFTRQGTALDMVPDGIELPNLTEEQLT